MAGATFGTAVARAGLDAVLKLVTVQAQTVKLALDGWRLRRSAEIGRLSLQGVVASDQLLMRLQITDPVRAQRPRQLLDLFGDALLLGDVGGMLDQELTERALDKVATLGPRVAL